MLKRIIGAFAVILAAGCAATYAPPKLAPTNFSKEIQKPAGEIFAAAKRALVLDGYQVVGSDEGAGVISTGKRQIRLTQADTDCGTTAGIHYIKDKRTITNVTVGIVVSDGNIKINTNIEGEYLKGNVTQGIALKCVSTGQIEEQLFTRIKGQMR